MRVYYLRHQATGVLHEYPFAQPPTAEQLAPLLAECRRLHGDDSPKGAPWWTRVVDVEAFGPGDVPQFVRPDTAPMVIPNIAIRGTGIVTPPKG